MKNRKKQFVAHIVTDSYFMEDEYDIIEAESVEDATQKLRDMLGEHLLACYVRKATWAERRYYKKYHICIASDI